MSIKPTLVNTLCSLLIGLFLGIALYHFALLPKAKKPHELIITEEGVEYSNIPDTMHLLMSDSIQKLNQLNNMTSWVNTRDALLKEGNTKMLDHIDFLLIMQVSALITNDKEGFNYGIRYTEHRSYDDYKKIHLCILKRSHEKKALSIYSYPERLDGLQSKLEIQKNNEFMKQLYQEAIDYMNTACPSTQGMVPLDF